MTAKSTDNNALGFEDLNPEQRRVVEHKTGPLLVLAGAGSGKTRAIVHRIAHLILDRGVHADDILAVTFTNKAAGEMAARVAGLLRGRAGRPSWISTFHSTCARLLRIEGPLLGLPRSFTILDQDDQRRMLTEVAKDLKVPSDRRSVASYQHFVERARNQGWLPDRAAEVGVGPDHELRSQVYAAYHRRMRRNATLDFGDLILAVVELVETDERAGRRYQDRWRHVLVDEFQDTNAIQYRLLRHLVGPSRNLMVVGDDDQCIYTWRGATVENLLRFDVDFADCQVVRLEQNYRSTQSVLDLANRVITHNVDRKPKSLWTENEQGARPVLFTGADEREEAQFIARRIEQMERDGEVRLGEIALFYRVNAQSRIYEEQLRRFGIHYRVLAGTSFYEREEIKDVLAYLRVAVNPGDEVACRRIANVPRRGVGDKTLAKAQWLARDRGLTLLDGLGQLTQDPGERLSARARAGIRHLCAVLAEVTAGVDYQSPTELTRWLLDEVKYDAHLRSRHPDDADDRIDNVFELISAMRDYEDEQERSGEAATLAGFLERTALVQPSDVELAADAVNLMTIHTAKGLEFPVVFLTGLEEGLLPLQRRTGDEPEDLEEERRLCYVAITRAKRRLLLTNCGMRRLYGTSSVRLPSRFLVGVDEGLIEVDPSSARSATQRPRLDRRASSSLIPAYEDIDQRPKWDDSYLDDISIPPDGLRFQRPSRDDSSLSEYVGQAARHRTFGMGRVVHAEYSGSRVKLTIHFPGVGDKKVMSQFVELGGKGR